jgi:TrmH family RNA methyltransferase
VKLARALFTNKKIPPDTYEGDTSNFFICEGLWAAHKLIAGKIRIPMFLYCPDYIKKEEELAAVKALIEAAEESFIISDKVCSKISDRDGADGFFIVAELPSYSLDDIKLDENMTAIVLDGQEQPGNIGAILRSLDGAGGQFAICTNRRVKMTHSRLIRSSLGAAFTLPVPVAPIDNVIKWLTDNKFKIIVTDLTATKDYYEADYSGRVAIVAGNEFLGISPVWRTLPNADPVIIPMLGSCESLNVGFASTLVAYESSLRQKGLLKR